MDSGFGRLSAGRCGKQSLGERVEARARALAADALQTDARPFHQQEKLVGELLRPGVARSAHDLGEPYCGVGERAAAAAALASKFGRALEHEAQLRIGVARMQAARFIPESFA